jgi:hypothetical protein
MVQPSTLIKNAYVTVKSASNTPEQSPNCQHFKPIHLPERTAKPFLVLLNIKLDFKLQAKTSSQFVTRSLFSIDN